MLKMLSKTCASVTRSFGGKVGASARGKAARFAVSRPLGSRPSVAPAGRTLLGGGARSLRSRASGNLVMAAGLPVDTLPSVGFR